MVLIDQFSSKTAQLRESTKNGSCKETFIEKMKESLGFRATGRKVICGDDTFELREAITPYGKANNLDSGKTFLWNQEPPSLIGQFLHKNWSIKTEILLFLRIFYSFFNMLPWPDPRTTQDDKQKKLDNPRERNISNRKYLTPFCSDRLIDSDIVGSLSNQKRRCCGLRLYFRAFAGAWPCVQTITRPFSAV